nr:hypothetical protein [Human alphaherpesvirus 2]
MPVSQLHPHGVPPPDLALCHGDGRRDRNGA